MLVTCAAVSLQANGADQQDVSINSLNNEILRGLQNDLECVPANFGSGPGWHDRLRRNNVAALLNSLI
eukprot:2189456-Pyramimonas_sp.AAC.1